MRSSRAWLVAMAALTITTTPPASAAASGPRVVEAPDLEVVRHELTNGLTLLVHERSTAPIVSAYVRFRVGSADERQGVIGAAHFVEHMLFKGTTTIGTRDAGAEAELIAAEDRVFEDLRRQRFAAAREERRGRVVPDSLRARIAALEGEFATLEKQLSALAEGEPIERLYQLNGGVQLNASTGYDGTQYFVSLPANRLELWARITADQMQNPVFREFFAERDVVLEERRLKVDNQPELKLYEQVIGTAYLAHPYQIFWEWASEVENLTRPELREFYQRYYAPNQAVIAIVGDVRAQEVIALIERYFGSIPRQPEPEPVVVVEPEQRGERRLAVDFDAEPQIMMAWHKPASGHPDDVVFTVIDQVLSRGRTSRFYLNLVEGQQVALGVGVDQYPGSGLLGSVDPGLFLVSATPRDPHSPADVEAAILAEIERLKTAPVDERDLERVKTNIEADLIRGLRSNLGLASSLASWEAVAGDWHGLIEAPARVRAVTPDDIQRVARQYLGAENRTVAWLMRGAESVGERAEPDRGAPGEEAGK